MLDRIGRITFGREGYVFAGREDGVSLTEPGKGRKLIDIRDVNGLKIVQELIRTAKSGGGFVRYVMPALNGKKSAPKLSYVRWVPQWGWYVGAGLYIDEIDTALAGQARQLQARVRSEVLATLAVLAGLLLLVLLAARLISWNLGRSFGAFTRFFAAAAAGDARIAEDDLRFREFSELGRFAHSMLDERNRIEGEKARLEDQLRQSQKMQAVGQLAGGVAHDFNNLLTVITGYTELASGDGFLSDSLRGSLLEIRKATARATSLTRQLLAFSKRQVMEMRVVSLNAVLAELEKMLCRLIGENIDLVMRLDPRVSAVRVDPGQLQVAIVNLALNAKDAMPKGGRLTIETGFDAECPPADRTSDNNGPFVSVTVTDTGTGMTPEVRERIFEPFFTTKSTGTGLGLSTVYGVVRQSGGTMTVTSTPGSGSTFVILLPRGEG